MSSIVLQPGSNTNPSSSYRVTDFEAWLTFIEGAVPSYPYSTYDNARDAHRAADAANHFLEGQQ